MGKDTVLIPRNVIGKSEKFPIEFIFHFDIEKRQIPYILLGGSISTIVMFNPALGTMYKTVIPVISIGISTLASTIKLEGQHVENMLVNSIKQASFNYKIRRRLNGDEDFATRFRKFTIQKVRSKRINN